MERKRRETGWEPPPEPDMEQERLLADMVPLLGGAEEGAVPEHVAMMPFMETILDSEDLIDEPEFDGVYAHPLLCVQAFVEQMQELGFEDVDPDDLPMSEQKDLRAKMREGMAMQMMTPDLQKAILSALDELRERAREEGDQDLVAQAAGVYALLDDATAVEMWTLVGVVQAVIGRSLDAGIEMYDIIQRQAERAEAGNGGPGLLHRLIGATPEQRMERVLNKYPGLVNFLAGQVRDDWEEGAQALVEGELDLGFFSAAEISAVFAEARSLGLDLTEEGDLVLAEEADDDAAAVLVGWLESFVSELATPERLAQMQVRLNQFAMEADSSWLTFLSLVNKEFEEADTSELLRPLLVHVLVGEIKNSVWEEREEG